MRVYYYKRKDGLLNFGDDLGPASVEYALGKPVEFAGPLTANIMGVGSIISTWSRQRAWKRNLIDQVMFRTPIAIWGSGVIGQRDIVLPRCSLLAVRGPLTQKVIGYDDAPLFGDPGLLASRMIKKAPANQKIGVVPHYVDKNHPSVVALLSDPAFMVIDVEQDWKRVLSQISACHVILSSSLHGLIVADSYQIPNARVSFSGAIVGGDFKFFDYGHAIGRGEITSRMIQSVDDLYSAAAELRASYQVLSHNIVDEINERLIDALVSWAQRHGMA